MGAKVRTRSTLTPSPFMETFKAFRVHTVDGKPQCRFEQLTLDDIDPGPVVIRTAFSAITYKDAMAARGVGKNASHRTG